MSKDGNLETYSVDRKNCSEREINNLLLFTFVS